MLMIRQLHRPADSNQGIRIGRALPRHSNNNRATRIVRALLPIHSPAEKANPAKGKPADPDKASNPNQETPPRPRANNQDHSRPTAGNLAADVPDRSRPTARNLTAVAVRAANETIRQAGAAETKE